MKLRTTLIVLLIGVAAWLGIKLLGPQKQLAETRPPLVSKDYLDHWDEIELKLFSGERLKLVHEPAEVMLRFGQESRTSEPFVYRDKADPLRVEALLGAIIDCKREALKGGADDLLRMGLDPPRCYVILRVKGLPDLNLGFGNDDPTGGGVLAHSVGEGSVFRTGAQVMNVLKSFNQDDWRSRAVFAFDPIGVTEIAVTRFDPLDPKKNVYIDAQREGAREWRLKQPAPKQSLMADTQACQSLAQQLTLLRVKGFVSMKWDDTVTKATALPDQPFMQVTVAGGPAAETLDIGNLISGDYSALLHGRGAEMCFTVKKESLDPLLALTADSLREHRLFPRIENLLVGLKKESPDGQTTAWSFGRQGDSPRGRWEILAPFHALAHEGKGSGCFAQTVVDLDKVEVSEFLDPATPFTPDALLELTWRNDQVKDGRTLAIARVGERTLVRVLKPARPDELFAVSGKLAEILALDPELFRDRSVFPGDKAYAARVIHWKLTAPGFATLEVSKPDLKLSPVPEGATPREKVAPLTAAASELFGAPCSGYVRQKDVPGDPFAKELLRLTVGTKEGEETLIIGGEIAGTEGVTGFYARLTPRQPDDVLMVVSREKVQRLIDLLR